MTCPSIFAGFHLHSKPARHSPLACQNGHNNTAVGWRSHSRQLRCATLRGESGHAAQKRSKTNSRQFPACKTLWKQRSRSGRRVRGVDDDGVAAEGLQAVMLGGRGRSSLAKNKKPKIAIVSCLKTLTKQSKTLLRSLGVDAVADEGLEAASLHKCSKTPKSSKTKMRKRLLLKST